MRAHHLLDSMRVFEEALGPENFEYNVQQDRWDGIADVVKRAVNFSFGDFYPLDEHVAFGMSLIKDGLFELPYDSVVLGWGPAAGYGTESKSVNVVAFLEDGALEVWYVEESRDPGTPAIPTAGALVHCGQAPLEYRWEPIWSAVEQKDANIADPLDEEKDGFSSWDALWQSTARTAMELCAGAVSMMRSRDVVLAKERAPAAVNKKRAAGGRPLIRDTTVITIRPELRHLYEGGHSIGRNRARLHWRRGHYRRLSHARYGGERVVPVSPCLVGSGEGGQVPAPKDYRVGSAI